MECLEVVLLMQRGSFILHARARVCESSVGMGRDASHPLLNGFFEFRLRGTRHTMSHMTRKIRRLCVFQVFYALVDVLWAKTTEKALLHHLQVG
jgi:hypothetical protein